MSRLADREALYDMEGAWLSMVIAGCHLAGEERQVKAALIATDYALRLLCFICSSLVCRNGHCVVRAGRNSLWNSLDVHKGVLLGAQLSTTLLL